MSQPLETSDREHTRVAHHHHFPSKSNILLQMVCLQERCKPEFQWLSKPRFLYPEIRSFTSFSLVQANFGNYSFLENAILDVQFSRLNWQLPKK